jgi:hypothetical protein
MLCLAPLPPHLPHRWQALQTRVACSSSYAYFHVCRRTQRCGPMLTSCLSPLHRSCTWPQLRLLLFPAKPASLPRKCTARNNATHLMLCLAPSSPLTSAATARHWYYPIPCLQKDPALRPNADQLFEHPFIAAAASSAPPQLLLRIADLGQRRRPVVGGRGSEPGADYAVSATAFVAAVGGLLIMHLVGEAYERSRCMPTRLPRLHTPGTLGVGFRSGWSISVSLEHGVCRPGPATAAAVVGGRGSEPGGDYAVSATTCLLLLEDSLSCKVWMKHMNGLACHLRMPRPHTPDIVGF